MPPPNDDFADRTVLVGSSVSVAGSISDATIEPGEPEHAGYALASRATIWWSWTAPATGTATVHMVSNVADPRLLVAYIGSDLSTLRPVNRTRIGQWDLHFHAVVGTTYQIVMERQYSVPFDEFQLQLTLADGPPNDDLADAIELTGLTLKDPLVRVVGSNENASAEAAEPNYGSGEPYRSVWWRWTAPRSGSIRLDFWRTQFSIESIVMTGRSIDEAEPVMQVEADKKVHVAVVAGGTYFFGVDSYYTTTGPLDFEVTYTGERTNDNFADRAGFSQTQMWVSGDLTGGTAETGEPAHGGVPAARSLWWMWFPGVSATGVVEVEGEGFIPNFEVYTGETLQALTPVTRQPHASDGTVHFRTDRLTGYIVAVDHPVERKRFTVHFKRETQPGNDDFARALDAGSLDVISGSTTDFATVEPGEPAHATGASASVWWTWTAPGTGAVVMDTEGSAFDTVLDVYTGAELASLVQVASNNDVSTDDRSSRVILPVVGGTTYRIAIAGVAGATGACKFNLRFSPPPPNDNFASQWWVAGTDIDMPFTTLGSTTEADDPALGGDVGAANSVWWTWTAPESGLVGASLDADFSAVLGVYSGAALTSLERRAYDVPMAPRGPRMAFRVTGGETLHFLIAGQHGATGDAILSVSYISPPPNDHFASRTRISGWTCTDSASTLGATIESGEPGHGGATPFASIWWSWTCPETGPVEMALTAADFGAKVAVYAGDSLGSLVFVPTTTPSAERTRFSATAGTVYSIVLYGEGTDSGGVQLSLESVMPHADVQPAAAVSAGGRMTLAAAVSGAGPVSIQWEKDGIAIPGADGATMILESVQTYDSGTYSVVVQNVWGTSRSTPMPVSVAPAGASDAHTANLSARLSSQGGGDALIPGFVISGAGTKRLLVRAVGPGLIRLGVSNVLPDPRLELVQLVGESRIPVASCEDWVATAELVASAREVGAFGLSQGSLDAAMLVDLPAGSYTSVVRDVLDRAGIAIVELYDVDAAGGGPSLVNISNRGHVGTGAEIMIGGFIVTGNGPRTFLIRAVGPGLIRFGVEGVLDDPVLEVFRAEQASSPKIRLFGNDDWESGPNPIAIAEAARVVNAFRLPAGGKDAALLVTLEPGAYTAHAVGANGSSGVALIEVYLVP